MKRAIGKAFLRLVERMALGYDAGDSSRFRKDLGWGRATPRDEDSLVGPDGTLEKIRLKCNDLARNNAIVGGFGDRVALWTVGATGINPQVKTSDDGWNKAAEQWWKEVYAPSCDSRGRVTLHGFQWMAVALRPTQGGIYFELLADGTIRPIETERIRNPKDQRIAKGYADGVKMDRKSGKILAYRVHARDESGTFGATHEEADVDAKYILPVVRAPWRPDQIREIPDFAPIVPALQDIHDANTYTLNTMKVQSQIIAFLKKIGGGGANSFMRGETTRQVGQRQTWKTDWGQVLEGFQGDDLEFKYSPVPGATHIPYMRMQLTLCSACVGFPYEFFTLDLSGLNFSRQKGLLLMINHAARPWKHWLIERFMQPLWNWRIAMAMRPGGPLYASNLPVDANGVSEFARVEWQSPEEPWIDRQEAQQADVLEVQTGLTNVFAAAKRRGGDLEDNFRANAKAARLAQQIATEEGVSPDQIYKLQIPGQNGTIQKEDSDKAAIPSQDKRDKADDNEGREDE